MFIGPGHSVHVNFRKEKKQALCKLLFQGAVAVD